MSKQASFFFCFEIFWSFFVHNRHQNIANYHKSDPLSALITIITVINQSIFKCPLSITLMQPCKMMARAKLHIKTLDMFGLVILLAQSIRNCCLMQGKPEREDLVSEKHIQTEGQQFSLDKMERGKKSQYLSMRHFAVHRELKTRGGQGMEAIIKRRPVNKKLNNNCDFAHEDDVLDLLFVRGPKQASEQVQKREMAILNKYYQKSCEKISSVLPDGSIAVGERREYCKIPKIQFKVNEFVRTFDRQSQQARFKEKQTVARSFVYRDYGFTALEAQLAENPEAVKVQLKRYRNLLGTVLTQAFRRMETFAIEQCLMEVKPLNRAELKVLFINLLNCRTCFSAPDCETLLKYVTMCFSLGDVSITADSTVKLMTAIQQALQRRIEEKSGKGQSGDRDDMLTSRGGFTNEKYQMHKIWNGEMERLLLDSYRRQADLNRIVKIFKRAYPKRQCYFTADALRTRINRTLRESFKKLQFLCENENENGAKLPQIGEISKFSFRAVMESPQLYRLRLMLLDVNTSDHCSHHLLHSTIKALNESLRTWESIRAESQRNTRELPKRVPGVYMPEESTEQEVDLSCLQQ